MGKVTRRNGDKNSDKIPGDVLSRLETTLGYKSQRYGTRCNKCDTAVLRNFRDSSLRMYTDASLFQIFVEDRTQTNVMSHRKARIVPIGRAATFVDPGGIRYLSSAINNIDQRGKILSLEQRVGWYRGCLQRMQ